MKRILRIEEIFVCGFLMIRFKNWKADFKKVKGGQRIYSDLVIEIILSLRLLRNTSPMPLAGNV